MNGSDDRPAVPRAVIHKRILDVAADRPDAPLEELAGEIPSATPELVERVLDEYGDPADDPGALTDTADSSTTQEPPDPTLEDLSETQRETLRAIDDHPTAPPTGHRGPSGCLDRNGKQTRERDRGVRLGRPPGVR